MNTEGRRTVKYVILALIAAVIGVISGSALPGCKTFNTPTISEVGNVAYECGKKSIQDAARPLLDDVASALVTSDYSGGIRDIVAGLVRGVGNEAMVAATDAAWRTILCAVEEVYKQTEIHLGYGRLDEATAARERLLRDNAAAWLASHR